MYTIREFIKTIDGVAESFKKIAKIGYKNVQISGMGPVDAKEVAKLAKDNGLSIVATHRGWGQFLKEIDKEIEIHQTWDCKHAAIGSLGGEYNNLEGLKRFLAELPPVAEKLTKVGIDFSYHNHSHELCKFGQAKTWLDMLYAQADPKMLKAEIDVYWITHGGGDPAAWIRKFGARQPLLHLKDMAVTPERKQIMAEIGEGNLNWAEILKAAKDVGVEWYLVEQDDCNGRDPFESLAISYRNLSAMGLS
jgi:sugar phosphate isomerase/epimerase